MNMETHEYDDPNEAVEFGATYQQAYGNEVDEYGN